MHVNLSTGIDDFSTSQWSALWKCFEWQSQIFSRDFNARASIDKRGVYKKNESSALCSCPYVRNFFMQPRRHWMEPISWLACKAREERSLKCVPWLNDRRPKTSEKKVRKEMPETRRTSIDLFVSHLSALRGALTITYRKPRKMFLDSQHKPSSLLCCFFSSRNCFYVTQTAE